MGPRLILVLHLRPSFKQIRLLTASLCKRAMTKATAAQSYFGA
jgi:hypothetical protein